MCRESRDTILCVLRLTVFSMMFTKHEQTQARAAVSCFIDRLVDTNVKILSPNAVTNESDGQTESPMKMPFDNLKAHHRGRLQANKATLLYPHFPQSHPICKLQARVAGIWEDMLSSCMQASLIADSAFGGSEDDFTRVVDQLNSFLQHQPSTGIWTERTLTDTLESAARCMERDLGAIKPIPVISQATRAKLLAQPRAIDKLLSDALADALSRARSGLQQELPSASASDLDRASQAMLNNTLLFIRASELYMQSHEARKMKDHSVAVDAIAAEKANKAKKKQSPARPRASGSSPKAVKAKSKTVKDRNSHSLNQLDQDGRKKTLAGKQSISND